MSHSDQTSAPLQMKGTGVFLHYLHRVDEKLQASVPFPLDIKTASPGFVPGGVFLFRSNIPLPMLGKQGRSDSLSKVKSEETPCTHKAFACRLLARVGYGSKRGLFASHIVANDLDIHHWVDRIPGLSHSLMPVHFSASSCTLGWKVESGIRFSHKAKVLRLPFALQRSRNIVLLSVRGGKVYETEIQIAGELSFGFFTNSLRPKGVWLPCSGLPIGATVFRDARLTMHPTRPALLGKA